MLVQTKNGLIERDQLEVKYAMQFHDNAHVVAVEWFKDSELVRRDVHVSVLRGISAQTEGGKLGA